MSSSIQYQVHKRDEAVYLCLEGQLDERSFFILSQALGDQPLDRPVKVDLQKVDYADSSGLRALILLQRQVRNAGVELVLLEPSAIVQRLFRTTGLEGLFNIGEADPLNPCGDGITGSPD